MAAFHQTIIIGNLGRDPECRQLPGGDKVANFPVAVTETWKDRNSGEKKENTTWYAVSVFGALAGVCESYLKKGSPVMITGRMQSRKYQGQDGAERTVWELRADNMQMLGGRDSGGATSAPAARPAQQSSRPAHPADYDDDIPF